MIFLLNVFHGFLPGWGNIRQNMTINEKVVVESDKFYFECTQFQLNEPIEHCSTILINSWFKIPILKFGTGSQVSNLIPHSCFWIVMNWHTSLTLNSTVMFIMIAHTGIILILNVERYASIEGNHTWLQ